MAGYIPTGIQRDSLAMELMHLRELERGGYPVIVRTFRTYPPNSLIKGESLFPSLRDYIRFPCSDGIVYLRRDIFGSNEIIALKKSVLSPTLKTAAFVKLIGQTHH
jgi:hypothetical protein